MTDPQDASTAPRRTRRIAVFAALAALVAVGSAVLYGTRGGGSNGGGACPGAQARADAMRPLARGEVAAVQVAKVPQKLPPLAFTDPDGRPTGIDAFRGRTVLVNLWATWCVPCRREMPALDALQAKAAGPDFEVVAINIDTRNPDKPRAWLQETGVKALAYYSDPAAKTFQDLKAAGKAFGMPTTLIVDPQGCELATLAGPAEWASEDALALIRAAKGG